MLAEILVDSVDQAPDLPHGFSEEKIISWLSSVAQSEKKKIESIQYVFCDDQYLYDLNRTYLQHETLTDIITFPYGTNPIIAEIYISLERVIENANTYADGDQLLELCRVMVHGLLHMCGYEDHSAADKSKMRFLESSYLDELLKQNH